MKGTKLWQAPGSPIIQGRSRNRRPFLSVWALCVAAAAGTLVAFVVVISAYPGGSALTAAESVAYALTVLVSALPGLAVGSAAGLGLARLIGTRREATVGAVAGGLVGVMSLFVLVSDLTLRGVTFK